MSEVLPLASQLETFPIYNGKLQVVQRKDACRISQESLLLAQSVLKFKSHSIIDLGTGCGIIPLVLAFEGCSAQITGVEIQPELAEVAEQNIRTNQLQERIRIVQADVRKIQGHFPAHSFDCVISNPPYFTVSSGTKSESAIKQISMREQYLTLPELITAIKYLLKPRGLVALAYTPFRLTELLRLLQSAALEPKRLTFIHHTLQTQASSVIVHARSQAHPGIEVTPPCILY